LLAKCWLRLTGRRELLRKNIWSAEYLAENYWRKNIWSAEYSIAGDYTNLRGRIKKKELYQYSQYVQTCSPSQKRFLNIFLSSSRR